MEKIFGEEGFEKFSMKIDPNMKYRLRIAAAMQGVNMSEFIRRLLDKALQNYEDELVERQRRGDSFQDYRVGQ